MNTDELGSEVLSINVVAETTIATNAPHVIASQQWSNQGITQSQRRDLRASRLLWLDEFLLIKNDMQTGTC